MLNVEKNKLDVQRIMRREEKILDSGLSRMQLSRLKMAKLQTGEFTDSTSGIREFST